MASTQDFRNGFTFFWNGDIWSIVEFLHVKPGKGGAFVRTKLKNIRSGKVVDNVFRAGEKVDEARVERRSYQFLYEDDLGLHLMNTDTYEQTSLPASQVKGREFIKEGGEIDLLVNAATDEPLSVEIPRHVHLTITKTDPGLKGDTATGATKPATLESGATVNVPLFLNEGDVIRVDTTDGSYIERVSTGS
ncbi:MAG: elongation factor P [Bacteroidota bacterium]